MSFTDFKNKLHPFELTIRLHGFLGWPAMTRKEMQILKRIFLSFSKGQTIHIFEYGMGFSTIYFAKFLRRSGYLFHLHSLDNNRFWYEKVTAMIKAENLTEDITLYLREFVPFWEKPSWDWKVEPQQGAFAPQNPMELDYVNLPQTLKIHFNVIFVDARFRRRCLEAALTSVDYRGFVIMHDAQKKQYHSATENYRYSRFVDSGQYFPFARRKYQLWLGSPMNALVDQIAAEFA